MRRFFILLWCSLLATALYARPVNEGQARAKAQEFFLQGARTRVALPALRLEWNGESASTRESAEPAFYVYNRTDQPGFVIIGGDDLVPTILAYSHEHSFRSEQMPDNLRQWMEHLRQQILQVRGGAFSASTRADYEVGNVVLQYETAQWDQGEPYNNDCPKVNGQRAATGCTATAFAIAMRSRRWPDQGTGTIPSYRSNGSTIITVPERPLDQPYQWDLMPLKLTDTSSNEEIAQVALLMADCGSMGLSSYGSETGALPMQMLKGAIDYMKYDAAAVNWQRDLFSDDQWMEMLKNELHSNGPVIYTGYTKRGEGHAFILDGYTSSNYFSLNWGWSGLANGYYLIDNLTPTAQGIGGANSANGFNYGQSAVIGFKKSTGTSQAQAHIALTAATASDGTSFIGLSTTTPKVEKDVTFKVRAGFFFNFGAVDFTGEIVLAHFNINDQLIGIVSSPLSFADEPLGIGMLAYLMGWPCKVTQEPQSGDYIAALYKRSSEEEWQPLPWDKNAVGHLELRPESSDIETETSITYDRKSQTATVSTLPGVAWELTSQASGELVQSGTTTAENTAFHIETSKLKGGSYVLTMKKLKTVVSLTLKVKGSSN